MACNGGGSGKRGNRGRHRLVEEKKKMEGRDLKTNLLLISKEGAGEEEAAQS